MTRKQKKELKTTMPIFIVAFAVVSLLIALFDSIKLFLAMKDIKELLRDTRLLLNRVK